MGLVWRPAYAREERRPWVHVEINPCVPLDAPTIQRVVSAALGKLYHPVLAEGEIATTVTVGCVDEKIGLHLDDPITGKFMRRLLEIEKVAPKARERLLGLSIVEFVTASWSELELDPEPLIPAVQPPLAPEVREQAVRHVEQTRHVSDWVVSAGPTIAYFPAGRGPLTGGHVGVMQRFSEHLGWSLDARGDYGRWSVSLGRVSGTTVSGAARLLAFSRIGGVTLSAGPGVRAGYMWSAGQANDTQVAQAGRFSAPWAAAIGGVDGRLEPIPGLVLSLGIEAGWVTLPAVARAQDSSVLAVRGLMLAAQLGIGYGF